MKNLKTLKSEISLSWMTKMIKMKFNIKIIKLNRNIKNLIWLKSHKITKT